MRPNLARWSHDANVLYQLNRLDGSRDHDRFAYLRMRRDDYFISLMGELVERLRSPYADSNDWSRLALSLAQLDVLYRNDNGVARDVPSEPALMAAVAFYAGGFSASAYVTLQGIDLGGAASEYRDSYELLAKPRALGSPLVSELLEALRDGRTRAIDQIVTRAREREIEALAVGPEEWVASHFLTGVLNHFQRTNIRAVLPDGDSEFWDPLVGSFLEQRPPVWDFFPSQIDAIEHGFLTSEESYSLQMPTGAGKTALTESLLYYHLTARPESVAVLLVPYRSLASELRSSLARRLTRMGLATKTVYGGSVPTAEEVEGLAEVRTIIATPEAMLGVLAADPELASRISLVICDEGHLLDADSRGVGLELLLSRLKTRSSIRRRFVFISAIVPNVEEINAWLGGNDDTVVRSDYKPTLAEFSVLRSEGTGNSTEVTLDLHPHEPPEIRFSESSFLTRENFTYVNPRSGRQNVYRFSSIKAQAVAAARKALPMGAVAIFAANKRGAQGAIGLAEELIAQLAVPLDLPSPIDGIQGNLRVAEAIEYLTFEFGADWIGTRALAAGGILHHGDIPQEAREVLERLLRRRDVSLAICTNTLAEGVNLPIRTLVLYSVQRRTKSGAAVNFLARDIKNLVGRAGRAGSATKGFVICANPAQWPIVEPVANLSAGERVEGALLELVQRLQRFLVQRGLALTDEFLERQRALFELTDGVDATLLELAREELGDEQFLTIATEIASQTFAYRQADANTAALIVSVFRLRASRILRLQAESRLEWFSESSGRLRLLASVETGLLPLSQEWESFTSPSDPRLRDLLMTWAWTLPDVRSAAQEALGSDISKESVTALVGGWVEGWSFVEISEATRFDMDTLLHASSSLIGYTLQVNIEQGIGLLEKLLAANGNSLGEGVRVFAEHLRYGAPTAQGRELLARGMRHRRIANALGQVLQRTTDDIWAILDVRGAALSALRENQEALTVRFGHLAVADSLADLSRPE